MYVLSDMVTDVAQLAGGPYLCSGAAPVVYNVTMTSAGVTSSWTFNYTGAYVVSAPDASKLALFGLVLTRGNATLRVYHPLVLSGSDCPESRLVGEGESIQLLAVKRVCLRSFELTTPDGLVHCRLTSE